MCTYSVDSREPAHRRALCLTHMLSHYVQLHACLFGSMRALGMIYFCPSLRLHALPLCALGHNNGSDVRARSECLDETVHLPRLFGVVDARI